MKRVSISASRTSMMLAVCGVVAQLSPIARAGTITKDPSGTDLSLAASWTGGVAPTSTDAAQWTSTSLGGALTLSSAVNWGAISVTGATAPLSVSGSDITLTGGQTLGTASATAGFYISSNGVNFTASNNILLGSSQTWNIVSGKTATFTGVVSGNFALTKSSAGTLTLRGTNTYSGGTTIAGGTVNVQNAAAFGTGSVAVTDDSTVANNGFTVANAIAISSGKTLTFTGVVGTATTGNGAASGYANIYSNLISGLGAVKVNSYALLTGTNSYSGGTTVGGFLLGINSDASLGAAPGSFQAANITLSGGTLSNYTGSYSTINLNANRGITLTANSTLDVGGGSLTTPGMTVNGPITGNFQLSKNAAGVLALTASNSYGGGTSISSGTVAVTNANALGTGAVTVGAAANNPGTSPIGIAVSSSNVPFLAYTGTASSVTLANALTLPTTPTSAAVYTISQTGIAPASAANAQTVAFNGIISGGNSFTTLELNSQTGSDYASVIALNGNNTALAGTVALNRGSLFIGNANALGTAALVVATNPNYSGQTIQTTYGNITFTASMTVANNIAINTSNDSFYNASGNDVTLSGIVSGTSTIQKLGTGVLTLTGANTTTGGIVINGGTLQVGGGGTAGVLNTAASVTTNGVLAVNRSDAVAQGTVSGATTVLPAAAITGTGGLTQNGAGTLTLTAANTYSGATAVNAGTLQIGATGATGAIASTSSITLASGATLAFNRTDAVSQGTVSGATTVIPAVAIGGSGGLAKFGSAALILTASNTYSGGTAINAGTVAFTNGNVFGTGTITVAAAAGTAGSGGISTAVPFIQSVTSTAAATTTTLANNIVLPAPSAATIYTVSQTGLGFSATNASTLNLNGVISGGNANALFEINTQASGDYATTTALNNANTFVAPSVYLIRGSLVLGNNSALGAATNKLYLQTNNNDAAGNLRFASGVTSIANPVQINTSGDSIAVDSGVAVTLNGGLSGASGFKKIGSGTLVLSGVGSNSSSSSVLAGTLRADNTTASVGGGAIAVSGTGVLAGGSTASVGKTGTGAVTVGTGTASGGGTITAGTGAAISGATSSDTVGTLATGNQIWNGFGTTSGSGGTYAVKFATNTGPLTPGTSHDVLNMSTLSISTSGGLFTIKLLNALGGSFDTTQGGTYTIARATSVVANNVNQIVGADLTNLFYLDASGVGLPDATNLTVALANSSSISGFDVNLIYAPTPEPTTAALFVLGGSVLLGCRGRRRTTRSACPALHVSG